MKAFKITLVIASAVGVLTLFSFFASRSVKVEATVPASLLVNFVENIRRNNSSQEEEKNNTIVLEESTTQQAIIEVTTSVSEEITQTPETVTQQAETITQQSGTETETEEQTTLEEYPTKYTLGCVILRKTPEYCPISNTICFIKGAEAVKYMGDSGCFSEVEYNGQVGYVPSCRIGDVGFGLDFSQIASCIF